MRLEAHLGLIYFVCHLPKYVWLLSRALSSSEQTSQVLQVLQVYNYRLKKCHFDFKWLHLFVIEIETYIPLHWVAIPYNRVQKFEGKFL